MTISYNGWVQDRTDTPASALWSAAWSGDKVIVERLIAEAVDVNVWDRYGRNALIFAAEAGHLELAQILIKAGAWVDPFEDYDGFYSPLMSAARSGDMKMVELLLDNGADPTLHGGPGGQTAESFARNDSPNSRYLAAILRRAEDEWRKSHRSS